jgi:hypothetical protein
MKEIYPLRLPKSLKKAVERLSRQDGTSINQFVALAVAEKVCALETADFFTGRRARADFRTFDKIMKRRGGAAPREGDEMPQEKRAVRRKADTHR